MSKHNIKPYYDIKFKHVAGNISMIGGTSFDNFIINLLGVSELQRRDIKDINVVISAKQYNLRLNLSNVHLMSAEQFRSKIEKICLEATIFKKFIENVNSKEYNITNIATLVRPYKKKSNNDPKVSKWYRSKSLLPEDFESYLMKYY